LSSAQWIVGMRCAGHGQPCEYRVFAVQELQQAQAGWEIASQIYGDLASAEAQKELLEAEEGPDSLGGR